MDIRHSRMDEDIAPESRERISHSDDGESTTLEIDIPIDHDISSLSDDTSLGREVTISDVDIATRMREDRLRIVVPIASEDRYRSPEGIEEVNLHLWITLHSRIPSILMDFPEDTDTEILIVRATEIL